MKIFLGYDATGTAREALNLALQQGKAFNAKVYLLASRMVGDKGHAFDSKTDEVKQRLASAKKLFDEAGVPCETRLEVRGREPGEDLVEFARENYVDLIIVGVRIRSRVGKLLLGSTAQYVILKAPCPVLTFKESE